MPVPFDFTGDMSQSTAIGAWTARLVGGMLPRNLLSSHRLAPIDTPAKRLRSPLPGISSIGQLLPPPT